MPTCKKCQAKFPTNVKINEIWRNFQNRKYCLKCSPFGLHNTRKLDGSPRRGKLFELRNVDRDQICKHCQKTYKGQHTLCCGSCQANIRRKNRMKQMIEYRGGCCSVCGYNKSIHVLCFHHRDPSTKKFNISMKMTLSFKTLLEEVDKCDLMCANCHLEYHHKNSIPHSDIEYII